MLLYAFVLILPITFLRDISNYTWTSAVYVVCFVAAVIIFVIMGIQYNLDHEWTGTIFIVFDSLLLFSLFNLY